MIIIIRTDRKIYIDLKDIMTHANVMADLVMVGKEGTIIESWPVESWR